MIRPGWKSEKAWLRSGITLLVAMPGCLLDHLTKSESLPLSLWSDSSLEWLVFNKVDCLLDGGGFGGQVEQIVQRLCGCCRSPVGASRLGNPFGIPRNSTINPIPDLLNSGIFI
jgi:hypothetical protein